MKPWTLALAAALCLVSCQEAQVLGLRADLARAWVATEPIQCLANPWEQDWLASHDGDYASYPKDTAAEIEIIKDYYRRQGVVVFEAVKKGRYQLVCAACTCPEGHTLYLDVRRQDVAAMLSFGYRQESPG